MCVGESIRDYIARFQEKICSHMFMQQIFASLSNGNTVFKLK